MEELRFTIRARAREGGAPDLEVARRLIATALPADVSVDVEEEQEEQKEEEEEEEEEEADVLEEAVFVVRVKRGGPLRSFALSGDLDASLDAADRRWEWRCARTVFAEAFEAQKRRSVEELTPHQRDRLEGCRGAAQVHLRAPAGKTLWALHRLLGELKGSDGGGGGPVVFVARNEALALFAARWLLVRSRAGGFDSAFHRRFRVAHAPLEAGRARRVVLSQDSLTIDLVYDADRQGGAPASGKEECCLVSDDDDDDDDDDAPPSSEKAAPASVLCVDEAHHVYGCDASRFAVEAFCDGGTRRLLLSDASQAQASHIAYPPGLTEVALTEVVRSSKRVVAGAMAFQLGGERKLLTTCTDDCAGPPLKSFLFDLAPTPTGRKTRKNAAAFEAPDGGGDQRGAASPPSQFFAAYAAQTCAALDHVQRAFAGMCLDDRCAILVPDPAFRAGLAAALRPTMEARGLCAVTAAEACARVAKAVDKEDWVVVDDADAFDGLERLIVVCVGLDAAIDGEAQKRRSMLYRGLTRAQLMVVVVNHFVAGGWLEFLASVRLQEATPFNAQAELERALPRAADVIVGQPAKDAVLGAFFLRDSLISDGGSSGGSGGDEGASSSCAVDGAVVDWLAREATTAHDLGAALDAAARDAVATWRAEFAIVRDRVDAIVAHLDGGPCLFAEGRTSADVARQAALALRKRDETDLDATARLFLKRHAMAVRDARIDVALDRALASSAFLSAAFSPTAERKMLRSQVAAGLASGIILQVGGRGRPTSNSHPGERRTPPNLPSEDLVVLARSLGDVDAAARRAVEEWAGLYTASQQASSSSSSSSSSADPPPPTPTDANDALFRAAVALFAGMGGPGASGTFGECLVAARRRVADDRIRAALEEALGDEARVPAVFDALRDHCFFRSSAQEEGMMMMMPPLAADLDVEGAAREAAACWRTAARDVRCKFAICFHKHRLDGTANKALVQEVTARVALGVAVTAAARRKEAATPPPLSTAAFRASSALFFRGAGGGGGGGAEEEEDVVEAAVWEATVRFAEERRLADERATFIASAVARRARDERRRLTSAAQAKLEGLVTNLVVQRGEGLEAAVEAVWREYERTLVARLVSQTIWDSSSNSTRSASGVVKFMPFGGAGALRNGTGSASAACLEYDALLHVFGFFRFDDVTTLSPVCKRWRSAAADPFWKPDLVVYAWGDAHVSGLAQEAPRPQLLDFSLGHPIVAIAVSDAATLALTRGGDVWHWGEAWASLPDAEYLPRKIDDLRDVAAIACSPSGYHHARSIIIGYSCAAVARNGDLYTWGANAAGQLVAGGVPSYDTRRDNFVDRPRKYEIPGAARTRFLEVACGIDYVAYQVATGKGATAGTAVYTAGSFCGELPHLPRELTELRGIPLRSLSAGSFHCVALTTRGDVYTFGDERGTDQSNGNLLGLGPTTAGQSDTPVRGPRRIPDLPPIAEVCCSTYVTVLISTDGRCFSFGDYDGDALGHAVRPCDAPACITALRGHHATHGAVSYTNAAVITAEGRIFVWGGNAWEGGIAEGRNTALPTEVSHARVPPCYRSTAIALSHRHGFLVFEMQP